MHGIRDMQQQAVQLNRINCIYHLYIEKSICTEIISSSAPMKPDAVEPDSPSHFPYFICKSHKSSLRLLTSHRLLPLCFSVPPATCDARCLALDPHTYTVFCKFEAHKAHQNASIWRCSCMSGVDEVNRKRPALQRDRMEWKWKLMSERGREGEGVELIGNVVQVTVWDQRGTIRGSWSILCIKRAKSISKANCEGQWYHTQSHSVHVNSSTSPSWQMQNINSYSYRSHIARDSEWSIYADFFLYPKTH